MPNPTVLRALARTLQAAAVVVIAATILIGTAVVAGGVAAPPGFPALLVWAVTGAATAVVAISGLLVATVFYAVGEAILLLLHAISRLRAASG